MRTSSEIDLSMVEGRRYECLPGCGMCCLCQPELLPEEESWFLTHHKDKVQRKRRPHRHVAIQMRNGHGACVFLEGRRCTIHPARPHFCRQFPFHFHVGERVQVEMDLSCRGAWTDTGGDVMPEVMSLLRANDDVIADTLVDSRRVYSEFRANCVDAGVYRDPEGIREEVTVRRGLFSELPYLGALLRASYEDDELDMMRLDEVYDPDWMSERDIRGAAMDAAMESLSSDDPLNLPVYCDEDMAWNLFTSHKGRLTWNVLDDEGELNVIEDIDPKGVRLLDMDAGGRALLSEYVSILNRRDSFMGSAFYNVDAYGYEDALDNVYLGMMATSALDLWWRASLLATLYGRSVLDRGSVREGIVFYDMDRLDAPTIGAFV